MRRNRRMYAAVAVLTGFSMVSAACGSSTKTTTNTTGASAQTTAPSSQTTAAAAVTTAPASGTTAPTFEKGQKIGLLYDITGRGDKSFNDAAAVGIDKAKADFGVVGAESTPTAPDGSDRKDRLETIVAGGNKLVIGVGFLWQPAISNASQDHPDVSFGLVDDVAAYVGPDGKAFTADDVTPTNVRDMTFAEEQGSYLVGVAAALKTKAKKVGFIGGVQTSLIQKFEAGFVAGVKSVDPAITVDIKYITQPPDFTGFNNAAKGKEIANAMYGAGEDIVYAAAGASGTGMFQAAKEYSAKGTKVWGIGVDSDQYNTVGADLQQYVLTSMVKHVEVAVYEIIRDFVQGKFTADHKIYDLKADGVGYATSGGFVDDIKDKIDAAQADIISGKVTVPTKP
ncbi:MAG: BMP family ABC transporter substrate-binding protein [Acidimicrobiales bacterium]